MKHNERNKLKRKTIRRRNYRHYLSFYGRDAEVAFKHYVKQIEQQIKKKGVVFRGDKNGNRSADTRIGESYR